MSGGRDLVLVANSVDELGGVTSWTHRMARLFTERGHRVRVVGIAPARTAQEIGATPYPVTTLYARRPPPAWRPRRLRDRFDVAARLRQARWEAERRERAHALSGLLRSAAPGGVVIVTQVWAMEWVALADTAGLHVVGMTHESFEESRRTSRFARVRRYFRDVDRLLALTREDADRWINQGLNNLDVMPNPLPWLPAQTSPRTARTVVSIGRLDEQKRVDLLLEAWAAVAPRFPDWTLRVYGTGAEEQELRAYCRGAGLDSSVEWRGTTSDVPGALRDASVLVQSSRGEGFPLVLLEAMACAVPCVAFDCAPGVREIVTDGEDGLLAPPGDTWALAERLARVMADRELRDRLGEQARRSVLRYSPERIVRRWEELFAFLDR
ncbi:glycosyltransferase [Thermobifida cellulosilytica]|uniref:Glycosyl transferase n=1 Tax=Thermobifida cellulosilytica TB100 TaxID=665004 RepID=A0A147KHQ3_THECS|nr:glycosyltransferase [Thermobifida cellulosilytica]KUP96719.1 glycosyl transferase [Thermobifida cellulosilytica TB100]